MKAICSILFILYAIYLAGCSEVDEIIIKDHTAYYASDTLEAKTVVFPVSKFQNADTSAIALPIVKDPCEPKYPRLATRLGIEGEVVIKVWVDTDGVVKRATVVPDTNRIQAAENAYLEDATLRAAMRWTFTPATYHGKTIPYPATIRFQYKLIGGPIEFKSAKYDFDAIGFVANDTCALRVGYSAPLFKVGGSDNEGPKDTTNVTPPSVVKQVVPIYPREAQLMGAEGCVVVKVWISPEGKANYAVIMRTTNPGFNAAALYAAVQTQFSPAKDDGKPIAVWVVIPYTFRFPGD